MKFYHNEMLESIKKHLFSNYVLIIYGPRQVGKTTLVKKLIDSTDKRCVYVDCERKENEDVLNTENIELIRKHVGEADIMIFDEAQNIKNIGTILKQLFDNYPNCQYIATGSSSFSLNQKVGEPLVGRSKEFILLAPAIIEIIKINNDNLLPKNILNQSAVLNHMLWGNYPKYIELGHEDKIKQLQLVSEQLLCRDALEYEGIKKSSLVFDLVRLLAMQIGGECSYHELANRLQISSETVKRYIDVLEKTFVIFRVSSLKKNLRHEISHNVKIYFYDLGMRNAILRNFNSIDINFRNDIGGIFENMFILERKKYFYNKHIPEPIWYFWRTHTGKEIDFVEDDNGKYKVYECKYTKHSKSIDKIFPQEFFDTYGECDKFVIDKENIIDFF